MAAASSPRHARVEWLDSVRGLAAFAVLLSHYFDAFGVPAPAVVRRALASPPLVVVRDGAAAVSMFFVLSGLVLSLRHFRTSASPALGRFGLGGYCLGRVIRLCVPYVAMLAVAFGAAVWLGNLPPAGGGMREVWTDILARQPGPFLAQVPLLQSTPFTLLPQAWSLAVELAVSLLVPLAVLVAARGSGWLLVAATAAVWLAGLSPFALHFALGVVIAKHAEALPRVLARRGARWAASAAGLCLYSCPHAIVWATRWHAATPWMYAASGAGAALMLACGFASPRVRSALSGRQLRWLGKVSFSLYLTHYTVVLFVAPRVMARSAALGVGAGWLVTLAVTVALCLLAAAVFFRAVEVPTMAAARRCPEWASRAAGAASHAHRRLRPATG